MDAETKDLGLVAAARLDRHQSRVDLEQDVVEAAAEVGAVDGRVPRRFGVVDVLALGAEELDRLEARVVGRTEGQQRVRVAHDAWTPAEVALLEFVDHLGETACRHDVPCVHEAVEVSGGLFDRLAHVVFAVQVEDIGDQVERVLVVVDFGVEARQVEAVGDVFFVDLAKVFIATRRYELCGRRRWLAFERRFIGEIDGWGVIWT